MKNIVVLGAGLVGGPMAKDLAKDPGLNVTVSDRDPAALSKLPDISNLQKITADLGDPENLRSVAANADLIISAVPGFMGFRTLREIIPLKKDIVDIAFFPEDMFQLDSLAKENNVTLIPDMGVAPGMSHLLSGYSTTLLDTTDRILIYVGGLPKKREWPFEYKAVFSPIDVLEEYTRPARVVENGKVVFKPALSEKELISFEKPGTLEAFNSDGLRSLTTTLKVRNMVEKTCRYKGHAELMEVFRHTGFFSVEPVEINGTAISPIDLTTRLLFPKWKLVAGEADITVMKIITEGRKENTAIRHTWELYDEYDAVEGVHSMARTTGYAATAVVRLLLAGLYSKKGVTPPEYLGMNHNCVSFILNDLKVRNIHYTLKTETL